MPAKQWDILLLGVLRPCFGLSSVIAVSGRLGKRGSSGSSVLSSPNRPSRRIGVSHGPLHLIVFFLGCSPL